MHITPFRAHCVAKIALWLDTGAVTTVIGQLARFGWFPLLVTNVCIAFLPVPKADADWFLMDL